jgi:Fe-S-cluster containining protein
MTERVRPGSHDATVTAAAAAEPAGDEQVTPELLAVLEDLAGHLGRDPSNRDVVRRFEWLVEHLVARGYLSRTSATMVNRIRGDASVVRLAVYDDKRAVPSTERDCASLLHLCQGRCCSLDVKLSAADVGDGKLPWDLQRPYLLRKNPASGYCACLDDGGRCTVYDERPGTCRAFDCADDPRIWLDWDRKIPAPMAWFLVPPPTFAAPAAVAEPPTTGRDDDAGDDLGRES